MKAMIALLNNRVEILKRSKALVQLPAESSPPPVDGAAKKRKRRVGSGGKGTISTELRSRLLTCT